MKLTFRDLIENVLNMEDQLILWEDEHEIGDKEVEIIGKLDLNKECVDKIRIEVTEEKVRLIIKE